MSHLEGLPKGRSLWITIVTAAALSLGLVGASPAQADGGAYPSQAPTITPGQTVSGGAVKTDISCSGSVWNCAGDVGVQYYRLPLNFGDKVTFDFQTVAGQTTYVCVMDPSVTDYTVADADCLTYGSTADSKFGELEYSAGKAASYLIAVSDSSEVDESWGYSLVAKVQSRATPTLKLKAPKNAHVGATIRLHGKISPGGAKKLTLKAKSPAHGWIVSGRTKSDSRGRFVFSYHLGHAGPHEFRVFFAGKGLYDPASSKTVHVHVSN
jgi:hypothetical protein